ncbi:VacJ family lipoprotein [Alphaproteobacteria bacterium]|nr:VacJ family lipoprotein [Alphaproteobacteria bacterium]
MNKYICIILCCFLVFLTNCSYNEQSRGIIDTAPQAQDPWEEMNRGTFAFNKFFDKYLLSPLAKGYRFILPGEVRTGVRNFLSNLKEPWTTINSALQGDLKNTGNSLVRFCLNTTVGLLGIFDVASSIGFEKQKEDFGQTLAVYGLDSGPYLVLPLLGPSTVRDAIGKVAGIVGDPVTLALNREGKDDWLWIGTALKGVDFREQNLEKIDNLEATSVDFYATIRSLYLERRNRMIRNQSSDEQDPFKDFDLDLPLINDFE